MSGHNKWSTIKRKKGAADAKRSKIFGRIIKEIQVAVREGGSSDPASNPRLRMAIANAKGVNMPKDNIERAVNSANKSATKLEEVTFEGYLPNGVAVIIECLTDNNNRSVSNVRALMTKRGGKLETNGALSFLFERKGVFSIARKDLDPDNFQLEVIDAGAQDVEIDDEFFTVYTSLEDFGNMQKKLEAMNIEVENAELKRIPKDTVKLPKENIVKLLKIIEEFEDLDDVQSVYHNMEITDEAMAEI